MNTITIFTFFSILAITLSNGTVIGLCMDAVFSLREKAPAQPVRVFCWTMNALIVSSLKIIFTEPFNLSSNAVIGFGLFVFDGLIMLLWFYSGSFVRNFSTFFLLYMMIVLGELAFDLVYLLMKGSMLGVSSPLDYGTAETAMACIWTSIAASFFQLLLTAFIRSRHKKRTESHMPLFLLLIPAFGIMLLGLITDTGSIGILYVFCSFAYIVLFCCVYFILGKVEKRNADRELAEFEQAMAKERLRYKAIEDRREEMAKLRHDYRNVLTAVLFLLEEGNKESARRMVEDMIVRVKGTEG